MKHNIQKPASFQQGMGYSFVLIAGAAWACLGLFFRWLDRYNVPASLIALDRALIAGVLLLGFSLMRNGKIKRMAVRDLPLFMMYGSGIAAFFMIYIKAVDAGSVALASVLLYTAPIWIMVIAWWRWNEALSVRKSIALGLAILGSSLVAVGSDQIIGGHWAIFLGLLSGLAYALYSILSHEGLQRGYSPSEIVMYAMLIAAICLIPFQDWTAVQHVWQTPATWLPLLGVACISTLLAPVCYAAGQQRIGASTAGILATIEPVLAACMAWILLKEQLAATQLLGGACVLGSVILLAQQSPKASQGVAHE